MTTIFIDATDPLDVKVRNKYDEGVRAFLRARGARWDGGVWHLPSGSYKIILSELKALGHTVVMQRDTRSSQRPQSGSARSDFGGADSWENSRRQEPGWSEQAQRAADEATRRANERAEQQRRAREEANRRAREHAEQTFRDFFNQWGGAGQQRQTHTPPPRPPRGGARTWADDLLAEAGADAGKVYKALARVLHPDVSGADTTKLMQHLNAANDRRK